MLVLDCKTYRSKNAKYACKNIWNWIPKVQKKLTLKSGKLIHDTVIVVGFEFTLSKLQWCTACIRWPLEIHWNCSEKMDTLNTCNFYSEKVCSVSLVVKIALYLNNSSLDGKGTNNNLEMNSFSPIKATSLQVLY